MKTHSPAPPHVQPGRGQLGVAGGLPLSAHGSEDAGREPPGQMFSGATTPCSFTLHKCGLKRLELPCL